MPVCPQCENRYFSTKEGLRQHIRTSGSWHPFCTICDRRFIDAVAFDAHMAAKHPPTYDCTTCSRSYHAQFALEDHYRGSSAHPNCSKCGRGFVNAAACEQHHRVDHPRVRCALCGGATMYEDALGTHYLESPNHPSCAPCHLGFKDDGLYTEHIASAHSDLFCAPCQRQFDTAEALKEHLYTSPKHSKCTECKMGFKEESDHAEHNLSEHAPPPVPRPSITLELGPAPSTAAAPMSPPESKPKIVDAALPGPNPPMPLNSKLFRDLIIQERNIDTPSPVLSMNINYTSPIREVQPPVFSPMLPPPGRLVDEVWASRDNIVQAPVGSKFNRTIGAPPKQAFIDRTPRIPVGSPISYGMSGRIDFDSSPIYSSPWQSAKAASWPLLVNKTSPLSPLGEKVDEGLPGSSTKEGSSPAGLDSPSVPSSMSSWRSTHSPTSPLALSSSLSEASRVQSIQDEESPFPAVLSPLDDVHYSSASFSSVRSNSAPNSTAGSGSAFPVAQNLKKTPLSPTAPSFQPSSLTSWRVQNAQAAAATVAAVTTVEEKPQPQPQLDSPLSVDSFQDSGMPEYSPSAVLATPWYKGSGLYSGGGPWRLGRVPSLRCASDSGTGVGPETDEVATSKSVSAKPWGGRVTTDEQAFGPGGRVRMATEQSFGWRGLARGGQLGWRATRESFSSSSSGMISDSEKDAEDAEAEDAGMVSGSSSVVDVRRALALPLPPSPESCSPIRSGKARQTTLSPTLRSSSSSRTSSRVSVRSRRAESRVSFSSAVAAARRDSTGGSSEHARSRSGRGSPVRLFREFTKSLPYLDLDLLPDDGGDLDAGLDVATPVLTKRVNTPTQASRVDVVETRVDPAFKDCVSASVASSPDGEPGAVEGRFSPWAVRNSEISPSYSHVPSLRISPTHDHMSDVSRSPEVSSPMGLAALPNISPLASTPVDVPFPRGPVDLLDAKQLPEVIHIRDAPSVSSLSTSASSPQSYTTSPQDMNNDYAFPGDILSIRLPDSPTSEELACSPSPIRSWNDVDEKLDAQQVPEMQSPPSSAASVQSSSSVTRSYAPAQAPSLLHCRVCRVGVCVDMTATMCGHIFCNRCITDAVIKTSRCPTCATPTLLYCLFRIDLSV